jgi:DNA-binding NarL/FixJ family response regulator
LAPAVGSHAPLPLLGALLVNVLTDRGELDAAAKELEAAGLDGPVPDHWWFGATLWSRGYLRLAQGRAGEGVDDLLELGRRWDRDGLGALTTWAWASEAAPSVMELGREEEARELGARGLRDAERWGTSRVVGRAQRGLGLVTDGPDRLELLRESVRSFESSPARLEHARALAHLGEAFLVAGYRTDAQDTLRRAVELAHRCGARALSARATAELRAAGGRPARLVPTAVDVLTPGELQIAEMAGSGLSDREIAQALFATIKGVEDDLAQILSKLGVGSRNELAAVLHDTIGRQLGR